MNLFTTSLALMALANLLAGCITSGDQASSKLYQISEVRFGIAPLDLTSQSPCSLTGWRMVLGSKLTSANSCKDFVYRGLTVYALFVFADDKLSGILLVPGSLKDTKVQTLRNKMEDDWGPRHLSDADNTIKVYEYSKFQAIESVRTQTGTLMVWLSPQMMPFPYPLRDRVYNELGGL